MSSMWQVLFFLSLAIFCFIGVNSFPAESCTECRSCFYHVFTKSWVQTTCKLEDKSQSTSNTKECKAQADLPTNITIHGLWPQITEKEAILSYCKDNSEKFDASKLTSIQPQLTATWPTAFTGSGQSDAGFWSHEWTKHGVCSPLTMVGYFEKSLTLDLKYPIDKWLTDFNIVPSNAKLYSVEQVKAAFTKYIQADQYVIKCVSIKGGLQLLKDIMLCVSYEDTSSLVTCSSVRSTCSDRFYFIEDFRKPLA